MKLAIVLPCYNEQEVLEETARRLSGLLSRLVKASKVAEDSKVIFVDDGSHDSTWAIIERLANTHSAMSGIKLSRNRGHQNALLAGLLTATGDAIVTIDADLQDDINVIEQMVDAYYRGVDIVYGVRRSRKTDTCFKSVTAHLFYSLMMKLGVESVYNHADFRLMSRRAIESLRGFREVNLYLRGIVPLIGYKSEVVFYDRGERFAGETKYPLTRMVALALDACTSFSVVPLRLITLIGCVVFMLTVIMTTWVLWTKFWVGRAIPGWASTVLPIYFIGGVQILCVGVIGEYLGKIYNEVKARPRFIIEKTISTL